MRLVHVTTVPGTLIFLRGQPGYMRRRGIEEVAVSSPGPELETFGREQGISCFAVPMAREIAPLRDAVALLRLWRVLREVRPDIVDAHTPKGALLGTVAACAAGVPVRIYHLHGLRFVTARGIKRRILRATEWITSALATRVLCVSRSVAEVAVAEGLAPAGKIDVLLDGSINGVDAEAFRPATEAERTAERAALGIPDHASVIGFVGRLAREKGLLELLEAWRWIRAKHSDAVLLLVGDRDEQDDLPEAVAAGLRDDPRVLTVGFVADPRRYYRVMDVLALPTYREGFGVVLLEAGATGVPVVATNVPGCTDAVIDGVTGTLVAPRDAPALAAALRSYLADAGLRRRHGEAGRRRAVQEFQQERLWSALYEEYVRLSAASVRAPAVQRRGAPGGLP